MNVPRVINSYFDADTRQDAEAMMASFSDNPVVEDDAARHQGADAIRAWWMAAKRETQYLAEPLEGRVDGPSTTIRARVSGQFPGSPIILTYTFLVENDRIARLEIK